MSQEIIKQKHFWNREVNSFDSIYSHEKSRFGNLLDSLFRSDMYERFNYTMRKSEPVAGLSFLDVGCGTGRYSIEFARKNAARVVGLDISETMIDVCRRRATEEKLIDKTSFIQTDLLQFKPDEKFDVSIGIGLFDYIKDPLPVLKEMRECVSDRAIMSFPRFWTWRAPVRKVRLGVKGCGVYFYTKARIEKLLKAAGFESFEIQKVGKLHCVTAFVKK